MGYGTFDDVGDDLHVFMGVRRKTRPGGDPVVVHHPDARLLYIGDGVLRDELEAAIGTKGLDGRVAITGIVPSDEVARLLRGASLFALASAYEGMPVSVMEALASGIPVVATPVGEIPRVVTDAASGCLSASLSVGDFTDALGRALDGLEAFDARVCIESVARYHPATIIESHFARYAQALKADSLTGQFSGANE